MRYAQRRWGRERHSWARRPLRNRPGRMRVTPRVAAGPRRAAPPVPPAAGAIFPAARSAAVRLPTQHAAQMTSRAVPPARHAATTPRPGRPHGASSPHVCPLAATAASPPTTTTDLPLLPPTITTIRLRLWHCQQPQPQTPPQARRWVCACASRARSFRRTPRGRTCS
mmetsp:Transcript_10091/g.13487  ORF Transcript_10091/g.13487 Transcript_10091/m.13487 type:complete len:168 (-) Transcript_10091:1078-1581(-)